MENTDLFIKKIFLNFYEIVDDYLNLFSINKINKIKKISYDCEYGSIQFIEYFNNSNKIIVHEIYIKEQYRNQGLCKKFIEYLIEKVPKNNKIIIQSVLSKILYEYLLRFEYAGKKFILKKEGFCYIK